MEFPRSSFIQWPLEILLIRPHSLWFTLQISNEICLRIQLTLIAFIPIQ